MTTDDEDEDRDDDDHELTRDEIKAWRCRCGGSCQFCAQHHAA